MGPRASVGSSTGGSRDERRSASSSSVWRCSQRGAGRGLTPSNLLQRCSPCSHTDAERGLTPSNLLQRCSPSFHRRAGRGSTSWNLSQRCSRSFHRRARRGSTSWNLSQRCSRSFHMRPERGVTPSNLLQRRCLRGQRLSRRASSAERVSLFLDGGNGPLATVPDRRARLQAFAKTRRSVLHRGGEPDAPARAVDAPGRAWAQGMTRAIRA
jgi:hypothetical protein